jgi:hypothetical protein
LVCSIENGKPSFKDSTTYVSSFFVDGNYTLSGTLPSNPAALIYVFQIKRVDFDSYVDIDNVIQYIELNDSAGEKEIINCYIVGSTPLASDWLSLTVGGAALVPATEKIYIILTAGSYANTQYRWTGTAYVAVSGDANHAKLTNLTWLNSGHTSGITDERVACFDETGAAYLCETTESNFYVGDFIGAYAGLATETNWVDNVTSLVAGTLGDRAIGIGDSGAIYECFYSQYGWVRDYINPFITNATLISALQTSGNWTFVTDVISYYTTTIGDRGQKYYANGISYECINGTTHLWLRIGNLNTVEVSDVNYMTKPQIEVGKVDNSTFIIPAKYEVTHIRVVAETTTAGNITIGSTDGDDDVVEITALPTIIGVGKQLNYIKNVDFPTSVNRTLYVNIDSAASVTIQIILQKLFE